MTAGRSLNLPTAILINIMAVIKCVRTRNAMALVSRAWRECERQTREELVVRGNYTELLHLPQAFQAVEFLDLSKCSPWGNSFLLATEETPNLLSLLRQSFPRVKKLQVYIRSALEVAAVAEIWPNLEEVRLVRWHNKAVRPVKNLEFGIELIPLLQGCPGLHTLDLSKFYCWTEDVPFALSAVPSRGKTLKVLSLLKLSPDGFKNSDIKILTESCPELEQLLCVCDFDPRLADSIRDESLAAIGTNCPKLSMLHLIDTWEWNSPRADHDVETLGECHITLISLMAMFQKLPELEDFALLLSQNIQNSGRALEGLAASCHKLRSLQIGRWLDLCGGTGQPGGSGLAHCRGLEELTVKFCPTLTDGDLRVIAASCQSLRKVSLSGCSDISAQGLASLALGLRSSLSDVALSQCRQISTAAALSALAPLKPLLERLQLDCDWRPLPEARLAGSGPSGDVPQAQAQDSASLSTVKGAPSAAASSAAAAGGGLPRDSMPLMPHSPRQQAGPAVEEHQQGPASWRCLKVLSLWAPLGLLLMPLAQAGLANCPELEEVRIRVDGDCRRIPRPAAPAFGLVQLARFPKLRTLGLDLSEVTGFSVTCAPGFTDVSLWERYYLHGIQRLGCQVLDYWAPSDRDLNRRALSLPSAALLSECAHVRKLFLHATANEHLLQMLLRCKELRDVHQWGDYYPAPEHETAVQVQVSASRRFEAALASRGFPD